MRALKRITLLHPGKSLAPGTMDPNTYAVGHRGCVSIEPLDAGWVRIVGQGESFVVPLSAIAWAEEAPPEPVRSITGVRENERAKRR